MFNQFASIFEAIERATVNHLTSLYHLNMCLYEINNDLERPGP